MLQDKDRPLRESITPRPALPALHEFPGSLAQKVYMSLKQAILSLEFRPGEIMQKPEICAELGVSRSPVAEAVARLSAEGLVNVVPQAGTFVARFSMEEIREGAFLREALELAAIEMVATTITEDQLVLLRRNLRIQEALMQDGDISGFYQMDASMHELIMSFTHFKRLAVLAETAWVHVNRARRLNLPAPGRIEATLEEHKAIVAALEARDPEAARAATRYHLRQLITFLEPLVQSHPDLFDTNN
ncbi:MAG: GntR family transcriptional regulator [Hoeflea sp.]|nr:GntR family transcriptional regulator [Hoeflea sp.]